MQSDFDKVLLFKEPSHWTKEEDELICGEVF